MYLLEIVDEGSPRPGRIVVTVTGYEVVVKGRLGSALAAAFEGFEVTRVDHGCTHFVGWVIDQARLHSMLQRLRDLNIELISVNRLSDIHQPRLEDDLGYAGD
jgi:hypothetical protein